MIGTVKKASNDWNRKKKPIKASNYCNCKKL